MAYSKTETPDYSMTALIIIAAAGAVKILTHSEIVYDLQ